MFVFPQTYSEIPNNNSYVMFSDGFSIIISTYVKSFFTKVVLPDFVPPDTNKPNGCLNCMEYMMK